MAEPIKATPMPAKIVDFVVSEMGQDAKGTHLAGFVLRGLVEDKPLANTLVLLPLDRAERLHAELGIAIELRKKHKLRGELPGADE